MYMSTVSAGLGKQIMAILFYSISLVTWAVLSLTAAKFKPLIPSEPGFSISYPTNTLILMILYNFCLLPAQFRYITLYILKGESGVQIVDQCVPWKISNGAEKLVFYALQF
jgi:hypothetical protein